MNDIVDFGDGKISIVFCCNCALYSEKFGVCHRTGMPCKSLTDGCSFGFIRRPLKKDEGYRDGYGHDAIGTVSERG